MSISDEFQRIYDEFLARETVITLKASEELISFEIGGDKVGFEVAIAKFDNREFDAAQAIDKLTK